MDNTSLVLSGLLSVAFLILLAPSVLRMNKGKILQNIAIWLAIFCGLGLAYQTIGPGKNMSNNILPSDQIQTRQGEDSVLPAESSDFLAPRN